MSVSVVKMNVVHSTPVDQGDGGFMVRFWLKMVIDTGNGIGHGNSQPVEIVIPATCYEDAESQAFMVLRQVQKTLNGSSFDEIMLAFPALVHEFAPTVETPQD